MSMHSFKKYPRFLKYAFLATVSGGAGWLCYQLKTTRNILSNALDTTILNIVEPTVVERSDNEDFLVINFTTDYTGSKTSISNFWNSLKFSFAKRLLVLVSSENKYVRKKAIQQLARIKNLENWQFSQLSHMIDAQTAVGLARTDNVNPQLFIMPPVRYVGYTHDMIVDVVKDLLVNLNGLSQHPCMGYFISKVFTGNDEFEKYADEYSSFALKKYIQTHDELIPMCLESLLHHASVGTYAKDIANLNGLPLLMEIHSRFKDNANVTATICRIISYLSMHRELLNELYISGWISTLAQWVKSDDVRISIPAAKALANLDLDESQMYLQRLYPLHPPTRTDHEPKVDVVFVHGLLGGVFFTWRQRKRDRNPLGVIGKKGNSESITQDVQVCPNTSGLSRPKRVSSDPEIQEFLEQFETFVGSDAISKDYDVIWEDIPTNTNDVAVGPYYTSGNKLAYNDGECFTNCWPRDWLAEDCEHLRIVGVNYETNLSLWTPICPVEKVKTLDERSDELIEQLAKIGIGDRPIVWVTHSMGGLIVKNLLNKAAESKNKNIKDMYTKTKGLVFYSTPHVGSSVAKFSQASALLIWPSVEVQELQKDSPQLIEIHQKFLEMTKEHPMNIITFVETLPTVVSAMKLKFLVVDPESGNTGCGEYYEIPLDHLGICKPASRHSFLYQKVLHIIKDILNQEM